MAEVQESADANILFRPQAAEHRGDTWLGEILLVPRVSFGTVSCLALSLAVSLVLFLVLGEYTRKARVVGYVLPERGLIKVHSQQSGTITELLVHEGELVAKGQVLAVVTAERANARGDIQTEIAKQLESRKASLQGEKKNIRELHRSMSESAASRLGRLDDEIAQFKRSADAQRSRMKIAQSAVDRTARLVHEKFISESALQDKQADLLDQQSRLGEFERSRSALERERTALRAELANLATKADNELRALDRSVAEVATSSLENEARREGFVLAPHAGVVTAIQASRGLQVASSLPLMSLIPQGARLLVDLYVPSRSVGFVRVGSQANLQYQPFPYQKFGTYLGKVVKASRTSVASSELPFPVSAAEPYYIVTVAPAQDHVQRLGLNYQSISTALVTIEAALVLWLASRLVLDRSFTIGMLVAFVSYKDQFTARLTRLIDKAIDLRMLRLQVERLSDIVLTPPEIEERSLPAMAPDAACEEIELRNVSFRYADTEPWVLRNVSLHVRAGESVALVGPSGCGKTTLPKIMLGQLQPTEGEVLVGGTALAQLGIGRYRSCIAAVLQEDRLFSGSLAQNISFFDLDRDDQWVESCANTAGIDADIRRMPMGYNSFVGDMGTALSGGQKQRILLARALYKRPSILFLDEATSHLDSALEQQVSMAVSRLSLTRIVVAHRPETIALAGRQIVIERPATRSVFGGT